MDVRTGIFVKLCYTNFNYPIQFLEQAVTKFFSFSELKLNAAIVLLPTELTDKGIMSLDEVSYSHINRSKDKISRE